MSTSVMSFDFEPFVTKMLPELDNLDTESLMNPFGAFRGDPKHRTVVCRHWLLGLCQNGFSCGYLHRLDRSKMPACKHGKLCKIKNCHLKHIDEQEVSECVFFKQGFCYNGPNCVRRHVKRLPDEVPREAAFDQSISSSSGGVGGSSSSSGGGGTFGSGQGTQPNKKRKSGSNDNYKVSLCNHWLLNGTCHFGEECHFAHGEDEIQEGSHQAELLNDIEIFDPIRFKMDAELVLPFPLTTRISYFLFQAPDLRALLVSKRRGVWSVPVRLAAEINAALRAYDQVVAYMCVRQLKGIYGVVKIAGNVPNLPPQMQQMQMTPEFPVQWLRTIRISMRTVAQLKIGNSGMFVGRTLTDSKFESKVGSEIMYIAYRKPVWDWSLEGQYSLAEQYLVNQRIQNNEPPVPMLSQDALFGPQWIDIQMNGGIDPRRSATGGFGNSSSAPGAGAGRSAPGSMGSANAPSIYTKEDPGFIVMGSGHIAEEMFGRSLFGLPPHLTDLTLNSGAALFLLDPPAQLLLGVFQATSAITENIEPTAFIDWSNPNPQAAKSMLPLQIKFQILVEGPPIHIMDPELQTIFRDVGGLPMGGQIALRETKLLANLFAARAGVSLSSADSGTASAAAAGTGAAGGAKKTIFGTSMDSATYKPPFKNVDVVSIDIKASPFELKRRLLGTNGSIVVQIASEVAGSPRGVKIRIRGIGSGFIEGNQQELQEPLHFNVSAETPEMLELAVDKIKKLVSKVKAELEMTTAGAPQGMFLGLGNATMNMPPQPAVAGMAGLPSSMPLMPPHAPVFAPPPPTPPPTGAGHSM